MQAAAKDLVDLVQHNFGGQQLNMIVGHSLGGKTTLEFLTQVSQSGSKLSPPQQVWITLVVNSPSCYLCQSVDVTHALRMQVPC